jgi:hypothetical protein
MTQVILRDWTRPEDDDFKLNVATRLSDTAEALPLRDPDDDSDAPPTVGWKIIERFE